MSFPATNDETPGNSLGQLLLERRASVREILIPLAIAFCMLIGGPAWALREAQVLKQPLPQQARDDAATHCAMGCAIFFGSLLLFGYCGLSMFRVLRCYELGLTRKTLLDTNTLRFDELESFTFSKKQSHFLGVPIGSTYLLHFFPFPESRKRAILFSIHVPRGAEVEIEEIRDHVADIMSERMETTLSAGGVVPWTPFMHIAPIGVYAIRDQAAVEPADFVLTDEGLMCNEFDPWQLIPWEMLQLRCNGSDYLQVCDKSQNRVVLQVGQICDNFYPGLALATRLQAEHQSGDVV